eukprot:7006913-Prymnesium_polylepis.1
MLRAHRERLAGAQPLEADHCVVARAARQCSLSACRPRLELRRQKVHQAVVAGAKVLKVLERGH